jgi:hypothetical protein
VDGGRTHTALFERQVPWPLGYHAKVVPAGIEPASSVFQTLANPSQLGNDAAGDLLRSLSLRTHLILSPLYVLVYYNSATVHVTS